MMRHFVLFLNVDVANPWEMFNLCCAPAPYNANMHATGMESPRHVVMRLHGTTKDYHLKKPLNYGSETRGIATIDYCESLFGQV